MEKVSLVLHLFLIIGMLGSSFFGLYAYFDLSKSAGLSLNEFNEIAPEQIIDQRVENSTIVLITKSGLEIERGMHTPNFQKLKQAAAAKKITKIWLGENLKIPKIFNPILPDEVPPFYQVATNNEIIISYDDMIKDHKAKTITGYFLLIFPLIGIPFFIALIWGFKLRLKP